MLKTSWFLMSLVIGKRGGGELEHFFLQSFFSNSYILVVSCLHPSLITFALLFPPTTYTVYLIPSSWMVMEVNYEVRDSMAPFF